MFASMKTKDESNNRLLKIMKENRNRVTVSADGVIRVNLSNEDVLRKIRKDMEKLKELEEM